MTGAANRRPKRRAWPWIVLGAGTVASVIGMVDAAGNADSLVPAVNGMAFAGLPLLFAALGVLIEIRQPGNRIGWLLMGIGGGLVLAGLTDLAVAAFDGPPDSLTPGVFLLLLADDANWIAFVFPTFLLLYVFPTGRLLSARWRWAPWLMLVMTGFLLATFVVQTEVGPFDRPWTVVNPIGFLDPGFMDSILLPWLVALMVVVVGGVVAMVIRYRRSLNIERAQIKLVLVSVVFFAVSYGILALSESYTNESSLVALLLPIGFGGIPVAITLAVLKHGLFDIDVVISRSITFGALAIFIGAVYVGIVVGIGEMVGAGGSAGFGFSILATVLVALAFQPARRRVEHWANRLVFGERATPYEILAGFAQRAAEMSDEELLDRIPRLIVDGTGASEAAVWVRVGDGYRTVSSWPDAARLRTVNDAGPFQDPDADFSLPVYQDGEVLGGLSLVKERGETMKPAETELLESLADGLGLTMRNTLLTERLRLQVLDLRESRDRVVKAADEARRGLEHDLDSGPQQRLVAIKVKLGPTRKLALQQGAEKTAALLADIERQAGEAIQAVRDFAGGIYPPLLESDGLAIALSHQTRRAAIPVEIRADGVARHTRDVESAVYYSILEALQNTAKYAGATMAGSSWLKPTGRWSSRSGTTAAASTRPPSNPEPVSTASRTVSTRLVAHGTLIRSPGRAPPSPVPCPSATPYQCERRRREGRLHRGSRDRGWAGDLRETYPRFSGAGHGVRLIPGFAACHTSTSVSMSNCDLGMNASAPAASATPR